SGLGKEVVRSKTRAVLYGQTAQKITDAIEAAQEKYGQEVTIVRADSLETAVKEARAMARPYDVVVLSPGCASFDQFRNSKERGKRFKRLVNEFKPQAD
ncbi:UDP-N-acetylmuramoyl-L-alanine--D-glutamate ligase, partial [Acidobacteriota bacterium]